MNAFEYCQYSIHTGYYKLIDNFDLKQQIDANPVNFAYFTLGSHVAVAYGPALVSMPISVQVFLLAQSCAKLCCF